MTETQQTTPTTPAAGERIVTYAIRNLCHRTDMDLSRHGFTIDLSPAWREAVAASGIEQKNIDYMLSMEGRRWLDCAGFDAIFDPDNCGFGADKKRKPGPDARPLYDVTTSLRVKWGEWGPEHIDVPGNACGLDIEPRSFGCLFENGARLLPHNIDSLHQKYLLLIVFTEIAETLHYAGVRA